MGKRDQLGRSWWIKSIVLPSLDRQATEQLQIPLTRPQQTIMSREGHSDAGAQSQHPLDDKTHINHIEECLPHGGTGALPDVEIKNVDKFGGHSKTDPKEIALVRKLDWFMLVGHRLGNAI